MATFATGCSLVLAGRDLHPLDSTKKFNRLIFGSSSFQAFPRAITMSAVSITLRAHHCDLRHAVRDSGIPFRAGAIDPGLASFPTGSCAFDASRSMKIGVGNVAVLAEPTLTNSRRNRMSPGSNPLASAPIVGLGATRRFDACVAAWPSPATSPLEQCCNNRPTGKAVLAKKYAPLKHSCSCLGADYSLTFFPKTIASTDRLGRFRSARQCDRDGIRIRVPGVLGYAEDDLSDLGVDVNSLHERPNDFSSSLPVSAC